MANLNVNLKKSESKYGGFYRLENPKKKPLEKVGQFLIHLIKLPYTLFQILVGRLLSYLVINPLFRKEEKDDALIVQNPKYPDPLFMSSEEMDVINILPKKHILVRELLNWRNFLVNHTITVKVLDVLLSWVTHLFPKPRAEKYIDSYLDKVVSKVEAKIKGDNPKFKPDQIHFRGLEQLNEVQQERFYQKLQQRLGYDFRQNRSHLYFYKLQTPDNAILDSVEVRNPKSANHDIAKRRFIITAMPRSNNFVDWLKLYQIYARELNVTVIAFNYRGIGLSKGIIKSEQDLYDDALAQAQRLIKLGADPQNIGFMGECLGGNVAAHTAGTLHAEDNLPVKLYDARSFRSITAIIEQRSRPPKGANPLHPKTWLNWFIHGSVKLILNPLIVLSGWSLNVEKQFSAIPPHDRDFVVVRSKKDKQGKRFADDKLVPYNKASIYAFVKEKTKALTAKKQQGQTLSATEEEWLQDNPKSHKFYVSEEKYKNARTANGHIVLSHLLVPTCPNACESVQPDSRQYSFNFFKRVWPEQEARSTPLDQKFISAP
ncbi:alpha/beta hydrolase fold domain-containing protein [Legionella gresilensis]|uniref:alpha/beta hydrolase fold domain-containing protein n=1 Tax=Legionella gresilensis TaxID=91823 RepID=UPI001040F37F|nr:alpha/beta hydrolase fold domain-containing protein [Legionella gresilensis]